MFSPVARRSPGADPVRPDLNAQPNTKPSRRQLHRLWQPGGVPVRTLRPDACDRHEV